MRTGREDDEELQAATPMEAELARRLTEGKMEAPDAGAAAAKRLSPRWEIRIQTERDPVAEETKIYRSLAEEADDRYAQYGDGDKRREP